MRKEKTQLPHFLVSNWYIAKAIYKCGQEIIGTLQQHTMHIYIHDILIPKMLEGIPNGKTKAKLLENYGLTTICQETVGEWVVKLVFKNDYSANNY